ncbi:MAG: serine hydrolase [Clostridia bacterium]|nr:serine hydrolase [Clostridia bacterium]
MKFLNFLRAITALLLGCALLLFWYSAEKKGPTVIPVDTETESDVSEEAVPNTEELLNDITALENNPLEEANSRVYEYLQICPAENPKASYLAYNLITGENYSYNIDTRITMASVIKSAYCLYVTELIVSGEADFEEKLTYTADDKRNGTGIIKDNPYGTEYSVKELITLSITESDNVAHKMLVDRFGRAQFNSYLDNFSIESMHLYSGGQVEYYNNSSARDLAKIFTLIYQKSQEEESFAWYLDILTQSKYNRFASSTEFKIAHKSGFMKGAFHDAAIVLADEPYILIVLTNGNITENEELFLQELSQIICNKMESK